MGFFSPEKAEAIEKEKNNETYVYFEIENYIIIEDAFEEVIQKINNSTTDIVLFGDTAVNRRNILYISKS